MKRPRPSFATTLLIGTALAVGATGALAQDQSAPDQQIVGTDGLVRYANPEEMWQDISSNWDKLGEQASERWSEIDAQQLMDTGGERDALVALVSESYGISEEQAEQEVTAWATSADDGM